MADHFFSDWESLVSAVDAKATKILQKDVAPVAEDILKKHIKSDIYDAYTPKTNGWVLKVGQTAMVGTNMFELHIKDAMI